MPLKIIHLSFDTLDSTQEWIKRHLPSLDPSALTCVSTQQQTAGRGRSHKKWVSAKGECLLASFYLSLFVDHLFFANFAQLLSFSAAKVLQKRGVAVSIKWPNDLLVSGKKIGGMLGEVITQNQQAHLILGIGINVNMLDFSEIDQQATSLCLETGRKESVKAILEDLIALFNQDLSLFIREGFSPFIKHYEDLLAYKHEKRTYFDGKNSFLGVFDSLTADGRLRVRTEKGDLKTLLNDVTGGETTHQL